MKILKIQKLIQGSIGSESIYFNKIKGFENAVFEISKEIMIIYFVNGDLEEYPLTFLEKDFPMLVRSAKFKDGTPFRVITTELDESIVTPPSA